MDSLSVWRHIITRDIDKTKQRSRICQNNVVIMSDVPINSRVSRASLRRLLENWRKSLFGVINVPINKKSTTGIDRLLENIVTSYDLDRHYLSNQVLMQPEIRYIRQIMRRFLVSWISRRREMHETKNLMKMKSFNSICIGTKKK